MKLKYLFIGLGVITSSILIGCGSGGDDEDVTSSTSLSSDRVHLLKPQGGVESYLFYGEVDPQALGGLTNVSVIDNLQPNTALIHNGDTTDVSYPVSSTSMDYNVSNEHYSNLQVRYLSYVSGGKAYVVDMAKDATTSPTPRQNSSASMLSDADYEEVNYLGVKNYLVAHDNEQNTTVLITPEMGENDAPLVLGDRKFLTVTYPSFGAPIDGYLLYNNTTGMVERCDLMMQECVALMEAGSRDFEGDVAGSVYSAFMVDDQLYRLNKNDGTHEVVDMGGKTILDAYGTTDFQGNSFYFISDDYYLYRVNILDKRLTQITHEADDRVERIRSYMHDWVIFGSDTLLLAAKKDGSSTTPTVLVENTQTQGYKYVKSYAMGDQFLFVPYRLSTEGVEGVTSYRACIFDGGSPQCRENSFWAGATAAKEGTLDLEATYAYTPYAYVRVDNTDSFGGGDLKAIDPAFPLEDGLNMGHVATYNFQTFLTNSRYIDQTIDSEGGVVFFAKNDTNFHVDAFYMNLLNANSVVQLTNTDPVGISSGRDHCHGRHCMICHAFGGGKIYEDKNGTQAAYGYRVRLDFEDGDSLLADVAKGAGENFSIPLDRLTKTFKALVLDANGTVVNDSGDYNHYGVEYSNCNLCHARYGKTRYDAPSAITITP